MTLSELKQKIEGIKDEKERLLTLQEAVPTIKPPSTSASASQWYADFTALANAPDLDPWTVEVDVETEVDGTTKGLQLWIKRIVPIALIIGAIILVVKFWPAISSGLSAIFARRTATKSFGVNFGN